ncbi:pyrimidine utilization protein D [Glaciecola sp. 1036]|uniref:pyrimidine utilization protein D n=1 Tax=Alteromonadaceae TaxID=72275 RepID=UPI003D08D335
MYFEWHGVNDPKAPVLAFSSGLGGSANFWKPQLDSFKSRFRILLYDHLGTGRSPAKLPSDYSIKHMANEFIGLVDKLEVDNCHFVGHAVGGLVGLEAALLRPEMIKSLALVNAWSSPNPHTLRCFDIRKAILANCSPSVFLQMQALLLYPPDWISENIEMLQEEEKHMLTKFPDTDNLLARIHALSIFDVENQLEKINIDCLVLANKDDLLVPWQRSQILANKLPNAKMIVMEYGGHASSVTVPGLFNPIIESYLVSHVANQ